MLDSLLTLKDPVTDTLKAMDRLDLLLTDNEWETIAGALEILRPFDSVTRDLSSQYYPSISKVIPSIRILFLNLRDLKINEHNPILKAMIDDLRKNMHTRFDDWLTGKKSAVHVTSTFLDPR